MNQDPLWRHFQNNAAEIFRGADARLRHLASLAARRAPGGCVLNVGIGAGQFERYGIERGLIVSSLDPDDDAVRALRESLSLGDRARTGRIEAIPFDDHSFDVVVASEVLEHLEDSELEPALDEVRRVLKPGGCFLGSVPAREDLELSQTVCPHCGVKFHRWGHRRSFDEKSIATLLNTRFSGVVCVSRPFSAGRLLNWKGRLIWALKRSLWLLGIHGENENLVFEADRP
jgi:SAM-dependent methyltransferase